MRVLLTNNTLGERSGTELYIYDVAVELLRRGHKPIAYSTMLGEVAAQLRAATVPVINDLDQLGEPPEIIHGQHHYETLTASLYFPDVPVVNFCHGWGPPQEEPFLSPRVSRYVAVDDTCRDRLIDQFGIAPSRVEVLLNFADTKRFRPRPLIPIKPVRALAFGNYFKADNQLSVIQEACEQAGMTLDVLGSGSGQAISQPETILSTYDVVFAKGRAALEAAAVGAGVILAGPRGFGPLVTVENWARLRRQNFGVRSLSLPICRQTVEAQLAQYDSADVRQVCELAHSQASLSGACDLLLQLYEQVQSEWRSGHPGGGESERAAARHLNRYAATFKSFYTSGFSAERQPLEQRTLAVFDGLIKGKAITISQPDGYMQGYVESAARYYSVVDVAGWAATPDPKETVTAVLAMQNGRCAAAGYLEIPRPDVAAYLRDRETAFGFRIHCPAGEGPVRIVILLESGELFDISGMSGTATQKVLTGITGNEILGRSGS